MLAAALLLLTACQTTPAPAPAATPAPSAPPKTPAGESAPATPPAATPPADARAPFATADALLDAVEAVASTLADFRAEVALVTTDDVTGDTERREGQVLFVQEPGKPATRRFAVLFTVFIDGTGRADEKPVRYLYADGWLTEADFARRHLLRRQLAYPGEAFDPLKPGEGPVPLPIGQRKEDVARRFETALATQPAPAAIAKLGRVQGLRLTPRPGMADRDLLEAVVWYDLGSLAPVGVEAKKRNGTTVVQLRKATVNGGLNEAQRALFALAAGETAGWETDERPLPPRAPAEAPAGTAPGTRTAPGTPAAPGTAP
jgi:hypothetical protein